MKITIDLEDVAKRMLELKAQKENDGYTNCLVDVLEEKYQIETKLQAWIPDAGNFSSTYEAPMKKERIQELRKELEAERISYGELAEIDAAAAEANITITEEMLAGDILDELEKKL